MMQTEQLGIALSTNHTVKETDRGRHHCWTPRSGDTGAAYQQSCFGVLPNPWTVSGAF